MPEFIQTILMLIFWVFIVSAIGRFFKKLGGGDKSKPNPNKTTTTTQNKTPQTFQDIFRELKKQIEESQQKQNIPPYAEPQKYPDLKTVKKEVKQIKAQQINTVQEKKRNQVAEMEKKKALEYEKSVQALRKQEHDAEQRHLEQKIFVTAEEEYFEPYQLDLRNAIIGSIILERKF